MSVPVLIMLGFQIKFSRFEQSMRGQIACIGGVCVRVRNEFMSFERFSG